MVRPGIKKARRVVLVLAAVGVLYALVVLAASQAMVRPPRPRISESSRPVLGLVVRPDERGGLRVEDVVAPAAQAGLRPGDRIVTVEDKPVNGAADLRAVLDGAKAGRMFRVEARRPEQGGSEGGVLADVAVAVRPVTPMDAGLPYEDVSFPNRWGLTLRGWYVPPSPGQRRAPAVAYGHGNASDRRQWLGVAREIHRAGFAQLLFDFAGRGESDGEVITLGDREAEDLRAALRFLAARPEVDPRRLALAGKSMGAVAAILAAARGGEVRALVLDSPYADLPEVVDHALASYRLPPPLFRTPILRLAGWRAGYDPAAVHPDQAMTQVRVPVLLFQGDKDRIVPLGDAKRLAAACAGPVTLRPLPGLGHNSRRPPEYAREVARFLVGHVSVGALR